MVRIHTFHQRHSLRENSDVALDDTFDHFGSGELAATDALALQVGIDDTGLLDTTVDLQTCIF